MTVKEFQEFCCIRNIVLKDSYNGQVYTRLDKYQDKKVTGFYPRFDMMGSNDSYSPMAYVQIVAWIDRDFERENHEP